MPDLTGNYFCYIFRNAHAILHTDSEDIKNSRRLIGKKRGAKGRTPGKRGKRKKFLSKRGKIYF